MTPLLNSIRDLFTLPAQTPARPNEASPSMRAEQAVELSDIATVSFVLYGLFMLAATIWELVCR